MQADVREYLLDAIVERGAAPTDLPPSIVALLLKVTSERRRRGACRHCADDVDKDARPRTRPTSYAA